MPESLLDDPARLAEIDWRQIFSHLIRIALAYALAVPIAWDREKASRGAGLRTFPLVAVGSCGYVLIGLQVLEDSEGHARILYGLMTGIGFIGSGAILKEDGNVKGTATAASIWITGAIGAAVAWQRYDIAVLLSTLNFLTLRLGRSLKKDVSHDKEPLA